MSSCKHVLQLGFIEANSECIVAVTCGKCRDVLAVGCGVVSDLGGGYVVIDPIIATRVGDR